MTRRVCEQHTARTVATARTTRSTTARTTDQSCCLPKHPQRVTNTTLHPRPLPYLLVDEHCMVLGGRVVCNRVEVLLVATPAIGWRMAQRGRSTGRQGQPQPEPPSATLLEPAPPPPRPSHDPCHPCCWGQAQHSEVPPSPFPSPLSNRPLGATPASSVDRARGMQEGRIKNARAPP